MDMGQPNGSVDMQDPESQDTEVGASGPTTITIVIDGDKITVNGEAADIGEAMKQVLDAYEAQETPDDAENSFQSGLASSGATATQSGG